MVTVTVTVLEGDGTPTTAATNPNMPSGNQSGSNKYSNSTNADAYAAAQKVYNKIVNSSMTKVQKGMKIFYWVNRNISFTQYGIDYTSWASLCCQAFAQRRSSCYGHWACCKAMCDIAGISNRTVYRSGANKYHVWLLCYLNGGWYHCDATPWPGYGHYFIFMMTDAEIARAPGNHKFLSSGLPARSTVSVQKYVNINSGTVSSSMPIDDTPDPEEVAAASNSAAAAASASAAAASASAAAESSAAESSSAAASSSAASSSQAAPSSQPAPTSQAAPSPAAPSSEAAPPSPAAESPAAPPSTAPEEPTDPETQE